MLKGLIALGLDAKATDPRDSDINLATAALVNNNAGALKILNPSSDVLEGRVFKSNTSNFLQYAVQHGYTLCVIALANLGVNINPLDENGKTPRDNQKDVCIEAVLINHGGKTSKQLDDERIEFTRLMDEKAEAERVKETARLADLGIEIETVAPQEIKENEFQAYLAARQAQKADNVQTVASLAIIPYVAPTNPGLLTAAKTYFNNTPGVLALIKPETIGDVLGLNNRPVVANRYI